MSKVDRQRLLNEIAQFFMKSTDFNGLPLRSLTAKHRNDVEELFNTLSSLIEEESICAVYDEVNPHVKRFKNRHIQEQIVLLKVENEDNICLYPHRKHLEKTINKTKYDGRPFSLMLALGEAQLSLKSFDPSILEIYRNDPRYRYENDDIIGHIYVHHKYTESGNISYKDDTFLEDFGFSYDAGMNRAVAVFLRRLNSLTPEHQQLWNAKILSDDYKLHPDYVRVAIMGRFPEGMSTCTACIEEMKAINNICDAIGRPHLFKNIPDSKPKEFSLLLRPTLQEFEKFNHTFDKLISENIDVKFFINEVPLESEEVMKDGRVKITSKGTLTLLKDWFVQEFKTDDKETIENIDGMIETFKKIRKDRSGPAHKITEDVYDPSYFEKQRELLRRTYRGMKTLRLILALHPNAKDYEINRCLVDGKIRDY